MRVATSEYERVVAYARIAMASLKRFTIPPFPQFYELWYTYAAGVNASLNKALDNLNPEDVGHDRLMELYREYIDSVDQSERFEVLSTSMKSAIDGVSNAVEDAMSTAKAYSGSLQAASDELSHDLDAGSLKSLAGTLLAETRHIQSANADLEHRLAESAETIASLKRDLDLMRRESEHDGLTGIANRKCFDARLDMEIDAADRDDTPLVLIMMDIDHFKRFNDTYGHQTGDQVLKLVSSVIRSSVRGTDLASRYGGEEFAIIMPACSLNAAVAASDKIREAVQAKELLKRSTNEKLGRITISGGVAQWVRGESAGDLIERADAALYEAKNHGRNCIRAAYGDNRKSKVA